MNVHSILSGRLGGRHTAYGAAIVMMALLGSVPVVSIADQDAATKTGSSVAAVPLSDVNLSTPEGMRLAQDRLHAMAEGLCATSGDARERSSQAAFGACVNSTVANALRGINSLRQTDMTVRSSVTLGAGVSLADLDLSTLEGERVAQQRLETMARRLCSELSTRQELSYQLNRAACVHDTLDSAWAQANAIRAVKDRRTAQHTYPSGEKGARMSP
jgi:UrcA family protein